MDYVTVFQVTQKNFQWWLPGAGILFLSLGCGLVWWLRKSPRWSDQKIVIWCVFALSVIIATLVGWGLYEDYAYCRDAYVSGNYSVVEGRVENFSPMPAEGHQEECFSVSKEKFCYSDYIVTPGFNQTASHGGPIRQGLPVRVSYADKYILRLEVRIDGMELMRSPSPVPLYDRDTMIRKASQDPGFARVSIAFKMVAVYMFLWCSWDWKRAIKLWWRREPLHPKLVLMFRVLFAFWLFGALWMVAEELLTRSHPARLYAEALGLSVLIAGGLLVGNLAMMSLSRSKDET